MLTIKKIVTSINNRRLARGTMLAGSRKSTPLRTTIRQYQVTVLGATSPVGRAAALLLRSEPLVSRLVLHDRGEHVRGLALDLAHVPRGGELRAHCGPAALAAALRRAHLVLVTAPHGDARFERNLRFIEEVAPAIARTSPFPFVAIVTEPIDALVPVAVETMRGRGECDARKVFGVTEVDAMRARALYAAAGALPPHECSVPVVGGHSAETLVPLLSLAEPPLRLSESEVKELTTKIRSGGTLAGGWAGAAVGLARWAGAVLRALAGGGEERVQALVEDDALGSRYVSGAVRVRARGAAGGAGRGAGGGGVSRYEAALLAAALRRLRHDVARATKRLEAP